MIDSDERKVSTEESIKRLGDGAIKSWDLAISNMGLVINEGSVWDKLWNNWCSEDIDDGWNYSHRWIKQVKAVGDRLNAIAQGKVITIDTKEMRDTLQALSDRIDDFESEYKQKATTYDSIVHHFKTREMMYKFDFNLLSDEAEMVS